MQIDVSRQKLSRYFKSHYISIDLDGSLAPEEFPNLKKSVPLFSKTLSLDITNVHYNLLTVNLLLTPLPSILILHKQLTWADQLWFIVRLEVHIVFGLRPHDLQVLQLHVLKRLSA